ncbi:TatD family hydrolase, partial [Escherichia coli]|nr:TatD family hydrolase [Escherichia coli]
LYAALGLHPVKLVKHSDVSLDQIQQVLVRQQATRVVVQAIGLTLHGTDPHFDTPQCSLDQQLKLPKRYDLPVILHHRRTHDKL